MLLCHKNMFHTIVYLSNMMLIERLISYMNLQQEHAKKLHVLALNYNIFKEKKGEGTFQI